MPEKFPESLFEMLYRRAATEQEKTRLLSIKVALGLGDRDELWPVILTLDHYTRINQAARRDIIAAMDALPGKVKDIVSGAEQSLESKVAQATARAVEKGAEQVAQITHRLQTAADRFSKRQFIVAASIGGFIALLCLGAGGATGHLVTTRLVDTCTSEVFRTAEGRSGCYVDWIFSSRADLFSACGIGGSSYRAVGGNWAVRKILNRHRDFQVLLVE